jgi:hypothetical protein
LKVVKREVVQQILDRSAGTPEQGVEPVHA